jgi:hypothetical protein
VDVSYSDVQGERPLIFVDENCTLEWGAGNIHTDPLFVTGPLGDYYLSQTDANDPNQTVDSNCVDAGSDLAIDVGLHLYTTRTDEVFDTNMVDMGYHYPLAHPIESCGLSDLSGDGIVNFTDQAILVLYWLRDDCSANNDWCDGADLTFDGYVNSDDLDAFYECWLAEDTDAPTPNPSRWEIEPYSTSMTPPYEVNMTAEAAFDNWGGVVAYYFECFTGNGSDRGWDPDRTHLDQNLDPDTVYGYRVRARDGRGNETEWSSIEYAITSEEPPPLEDHEAPVPPPTISSYTATQDSITLFATTADDTTTGGNNPVEYYFREISGNIGGDDSSWLTAPTYTDSGLQAGTQYAYQVKARDTSFWQNETGWSDPFDATTLEEGEEPNEPLPDTTPPTPNPSQWAVGGEPMQYLSGVYYWHTMTAEPASDAENEPVEYYFELVAGGNGPTSSGWQLSNVYDYAVSSNPAQYGVYRVKTRDAADPPNETGWSEMRSTLE